MRVGRSLVQAALSESTKVHMEMKFRNSKSFDVTLLVSQSDQ